MNAQEIAYQPQSIIEIFTQEMDQIFYPGYTEELFIQDPDKFYWEFDLFSSQFSISNL